MGGFCSQWHRVVDQGAAQGICKNPGVSDLESLAGPCGLRCPTTNEHMRKCHDRNGRLAGTRNEGVHPVPSAAEGSAPASNNIRTSLIGKGCRQAA